MPKKLYNQKKQVDKDGLKGFGHSQKMKIGCGQIWLFNWKIVFGLFWTIFFQILNKVLIIEPFHSYFLTKKPQEIIEILPKRAWKKDL